MVLNFGLVTQGSSRHLSISNHNIRSIDKQGRPRRKKRHASSKDYESSSDEDSVSSTTSDFESDLIDPYNYSGNGSDRSTLETGFVPLKGSRKSKKHSKRKDDIDFEKAEDEVLADHDRLVRAAGRRERKPRKERKEAAAAAAVAQIKSKLQEP